MPEIGARAALAGYSHFEGSLVRENTPDQS